MTLEELLVKDEIRERLAAYARGMDRLDDEAARSAFHPGARLDYGTIFAGTIEEFVAGIHEVHASMVASAHLLGQSAITVHDDAAGSETYVVAHLRTAAPDGSLLDTRSVGRYVDRWTRRDGAWRIEERHYVHTIDDTVTVTSGGFAPDGARDRTDLSYAVLA